MKCPLCGCKTLKNLYCKNNTYTSIGKLSNIANSSFVKSDINLVQCNECGYIFNSLFDEEKMNKEYQSNEYVLKKIVSHKMNQNFINIRNHLLQFLNKYSTYLEIGCGDGSLALELAPFVKQVYTIDPSIESININSISNLAHINDFCSKRVLQQLNSKPNLVVARHLLEHISKPFDFLKDIIDSIDNGSYFYIEVPNVEEIIENNRFYDVFNDHFGYFTKGTLVFAMAKLNMKLINEKMLFNSQHMGLTFQKTLDLPELMPAIKLYGTEVRENFEKAIYCLNNELKKYDSIAVYGAGAHGNSILDNIEDKDKIVCCFDRDSKKHGKYLQGTSIEIKEPTKDSIYREGVDAILISSSLYEDEIVNYLLKECDYRKVIIKTAIMKDWE